MPTTIPVAGKRPVRAVRQLNGRLVWLMFCGFFGVIFAVNGLFMHFAFSTFGGIDAAGAYRKNFLMTKDIVAAERQVALGWSVKGAVQRSADNTAMISVAANDRKGRPVDVKSLDLELRRPADKRLDATITMRRTGQNRFDGKATKVGPGQWDLLITLFNTKGERFHSKNRIVLK